jgi:hypothetical protein
MTIPGFKAEASLHRNSPKHRHAVDHAFTDDRSAVVLAQQAQSSCCGEARGTCTGFGGTSTATLAGTTQVCTAPFQFARVGVCRDINTGSPLSISRGCNTCLF